MLYSVLNLMIYKIRLLIGAWIQYRTSLMFKILSILGSIFHQVMIRHFTSYQFNQHKFMVESKHQTFETFLALCFGEILNQILAAQKVKSNFSQRVP